MVFKKSKNSRPTKKYRSAVLFVTVVKHQVALGLFFSVLIWRNWNSEPHNVRQCFEKEPAVDAWFIKKIRYIELLWLCISLYNLIGQFLSKSRGRNLGEKRFWQILRNFMCEERMETKMRKSRYEFCPLNNSKKKINAYILWGTSNTAWQRNTKK